MLLYRVWHELEYDELVTTLCKLFQEGYIFGNKTSDQLSPDVFIPNKQQIEMGLSQRLDILYGLTEKGGAALEKFVGADWGKYIVSTEFEEEGEYRKVTSGSHNHLENYLKWHIYLRSQLGQDNWEILPGTEKWEIIEPWKVTYWKTLPFGYKVEFLYEWLQNFPSDESLTDEIRSWVDNGSHWNKFKNPSPLLEKYFKPQT